MVWRKEHSDSYLLKFDKLHLYINDAKYFFYFTFYHNSENSNNLN